MTVGPKFNNYSSKMGNAPKYKEPKKKIDPAARCFDDFEMLRCVRLLDVGDPLSKNTQAILALIGEKK